MRTPTTQREVSRIANKRILRKDILKSKKEIHYMRFVKEYHIMAIPEKQKYRSKYEKYTCILRKKAVDFVKKHPFYVPKAFAHKLSCAEKILNKIDFYNNIRIERKTMYEIIYKVEIPYKNISKPCPFG